MTDTIKHEETTMHGEVASDSQPKVDTANEDRPQISEGQSQQPRPSVVPTRAPTFETRHFWQKIFSDDFAISDASFVLNTREISPTNMMHVLRAGRKKSYDYELSRSEQERYISYVYRQMDRRGLLRNGNPPGISFDGSKIMVLCPDEETLVGSYGEVACSAQEL